MAHDPSDIRQMAVARKPQRSFTIPLRSVGFVVALIVLCGLSFYGGIAYQRNHAPSSVSARANTASGRGGFTRAGRGGFGQVTAVSSNSITVQNSRTGVTKTYSVTSSTTVSDASGTTESISAIQTGDMVLVRASTANTSQASQIIVNPGFGGAGAPAPQSSSTTL